jgi:hypothetical protein
MYYSYIEIEYVATSFSPARTDLAVKLLIECVHAALQQPTSSVESAKEEEEPRCCVVFNANIDFKIIMPIALIDPITLLTCVMQRRTSLIFQGITVEEEIEVLVCNYFVW